MAKKEPTNQDILEGMNKRFNMVFDELQKNDTRFDLVYKQLTSLREGQKEIAKTQETDSEILDEVRDTLDSIAKAVDADALTLVRQSNRISRLEKALK